MSDFKNFYQQFVKRLNQARINNNPKEFQDLFLVVEPQWTEEDKPLFVEYCLKKAGIFALFGETLDVDNWMQKALQFSETASVTAIYFQWIDLYWSLCKNTDSQPKLEALFSGLFNITSQAIKMKHGVYDSFAFHGVRAFSLAALGKHAEVVQALGNMEWKAVPTRLLNDKNQLKYFYSHIYKMIMAALEVRSASIMENVLNMITMDDVLMRSIAPLYQKFNTVVIDLADLRPEFAADFNTFYQLRKKWAGFLPNYGLFTMAIEEENIKGLNLFFTAME